MATLAHSDYDMSSDEDYDMDFMSDDEENVVPPSKKASLKSIPRTSKGLKVGKKPDPILSPRSMNANDVSTAGDAAFATASANEDGMGKSKTIEERYQKKSQREHVLIRPDTYIGSVMPITEEMFVYVADQNAIVKKEITYTPGLFKIFDESTSSKQRHQLSCH
jgi:hypothetical protein